MVKALYAAAEHGPLHHVEGRKQRRRAMPDAVVRMDFRTAWLDTSPPAPGSGSSRRKTA